VASASTPCSPTKAQGNRVISLPQSSHVDNLVLLLFAYAESEAQPAISAEIEPTMEVEGSSTAVDDSQEFFWSDKEFCKIRVTRLNRRTNQLRKPQEYVNIV
jgi:hypothetical protein